MSVIVEAKPLIFSHPGKKRAYEFLLIHPGADHAAYKIMGEDPTLGEREFDEVLRAIRVNDETEGTPEGKKKRINPDIYFAKKEPTKKSVKKSKGATMAKESNITVAPKKRGRPPGSKKVASTEVKIKAKRGRPTKEGKKAVPAKLPKAKKAGQGTRYPAEKQQEIVAFILSKGRGGLSQAKERFGISYPTLARWVKAGGRKGGSKSEKVSKKVGRPKKSETAPSGHVLVSKKVLKEFQKGIANLEAAFGAFSNALRVLE